MSKFDYKLSENTQPEITDTVEKSAHQFIHNSSTATFKLGMITQDLDNYITIVENIDNIRDYYKEELLSTLHYALEQVCTFRSYIFTDEFDKYLKEKRYYSEDKNH